MTTDKRWMVVSINQSQIKVSFERLVLRTELHLVFAFTKKSPSPATPDWGIFII